MVFFYIVCPAKSDLKKEFEILKDYVTKCSNLKNSIVSDLNLNIGFQGFQDMTNCQLSRNMIFTRSKYSEFNFLSFYYKMFFSSLDSNWLELTDFSFYMFFANLKNNKSQLLLFLKLIDTVICDEGFVLTILQFMKNKLDLVDQKRILQQIVLKIEKNNQLTRFLFLKIIEFYDFVYCGGKQKLSNKDSQMLKKKFPDWKHILFSKDPDDFFKVAVSIQNYCKTSENCLITSFMPKLPNVEQELTSNSRSFKTANEKIILENCFTSFLDFLVSKYTKIKVLAYLFRMLSLYTTIKCEKEQFLFDFLMVQTERIIGDKNSHYEKMISHINSMLNNENKERLKQLKIDSQPITSTINKFTVKKNNNAILNPIKKIYQKVKQSFQKGNKDIKERRKDFSNKATKTLSKIPNKISNSLNIQNTKNDSIIQRLESTDDLYKNKLKEILVNLIYQNQENTQFKTVIEYIDKLNETIIQRLLKDNHLQVQIEDLNLEIVTKESHNTELEKTNQQLQNQLHRSEKETSELKQKLAQIEQDYQEQKSKKQQNQNVQNKMQSQILEKENQLKRQKDQDEKKNKLINDLESQLSEMKDKKIKYKSKLKTLQDDYNNLIDENEKTEQDLQKFKEKLSTKKDQVKQLSSNYQKLENQNEDLIKEKNKLSKQIESLEDQNNTLLKEKKDLKSNNKHFEEKVRGLESELEKLRQIDNQNKNHKTEHESQEHNLQTQITLLESENKRLKTSQNDHKKLLEKNEEKITQLQLQIDKLRNKKKEMKKTKKTLQKEKDQYLEQVNRLQQKYKEIEQKLKETTTQRKKQKTDTSNEGKHTGVPSFCFNLKNIPNPKASPRKTNSS